MNGTRCSWLLLVYRVPTEPSARRVYVWRKLKRLGAIALQDAVWILPANERNREHFQWLGAEIAEMGGEATVWEGVALLPAQDEAVIEEFRVRVEPLYRDLLDRIAAVHQRAPESEDVETTAALVRDYWQARSQDHVSVPLGKEVHAALRRLLAELTPKEADE